MDETWELLGWSGDGQYFRFAELEAGQNPDLSPVVDVLQGRSLGVIYRNFAPSHACEDLARRFWDSPHRVRREGEAPAEYLGVTHYLKTTDEYFSSVDSASQVMTEVLGCYPDPMTRFWRHLQAVLQPLGGQHRFAQHAGRNACAGLIRALEPTSSFALLPHEDMSQCMDPRQSDFEIQQVSAFEIASVNICISDAAPGQLKVWNIKPDQQTKDRLGISYEGIPYPRYMLETFQQISLPIRTGDLYVFNTAHVHAVGAITESDTCRVTIAALLGFIDQTTVVSWT